MKLQVPYYSQFKDIQNPLWKEFGCTITCLAMAVKYFSPEEALILDDLFEEGILIGGRSEHGWKHNSIVLLAHNHGIPAYCEEFKSVFVDIDNKQFLESPHSVFFTDLGIKKIKQFLENGGLPIVSVLPGLSGGKSIHTIILIGFEVEDGKLSGFYYHDPDSKVGLSSNVFITLPNFLKFWRKMAIFIHK